MALKCITRADMPHAHISTVGATLGLVRTTWMDAIRLPQAAGADGPIPLELTFSEGGKLTGLVYDKQICPLQQKKVGHGAVAALVCAQLALIARCVMPH